MCVTVCTYCGVVTGLTLHTCTYRSEALQWVMTLNRFNPKVTVPAGPVADCSSILQYSMSRMDHGIHASGTVPYIVALFLDGDQVCTVQ